MVRIDDISVIVDFKYWILKTNLKIQYWWWNLIKPIIIFRGGNIKYRKIDADYICLRLLPKKLSWCCLFSFLVLSGI